MRPGRWHRFSLVSREALALVVACCVVVVAAGCSSDPEPAASGGSTVDAPVADDGPGRGGVLRLGIVGPDAIDPAIIVPTDPNEVIPVDLLFDSLTALDAETEQAVGALAESWSVADDGVTWTFVLREGATFSDGEPVRGDDVKYSLERMARRAATSFAAARLDVIVGVDEVTALERLDVPGVVVIDDRTVQITTTGPYPQLPELLAAPSYGIVSRMAFENPDFEGGIVTSGPFTLTDRSEDGTFLRVEPAEGADVKADAVELTRYPSTGAAYEAFQAGELDWVLAPPEQVDEAVAEYGDRYVTPFAGTQFFAFNTADPALADVRFRRAIVQAIDRHALAEQLAGRAVSDGIVAPGVPGFVEDACAEVCAYDPAAASALVAEAFPAGGVPTIELAVPDDPTSPVPQQELAEEMATQLGAVGIPVTVVTKPLFEFRRYAVSGEAQLFSYGWHGMVPSPDAYLTPQFRSDAPDNVTRLASPDVDALLDTARGQDDAELRQRTYAEAEKQVLALVPVVPITAFRTNALASEGVRDLHPRLDGTFDVTAVWVREGGGVNASDEG